MTALLECDNKVALLTVVTNGSWLIISLKHGSEDVLLTLADIFWRHSHSAKWPFQDAQKAFSHLPLISETQMPPSRSLQTFKCAGMDIMRFKAEAVTDGYGDTLVRTKLKGGRRLNSWKTWDEKVKGRFQNEMYEVPSRKTKWHDCEEYV